MGERPVRFAPNGDDLVEVCQLCQDAAFAAGWSREGAPFTPTLEPPRRRSRLSIGALLGARPVAEQPVVSEPLLQRLTDGEIALARAADHFNATAYRRTIGGIVRSLGLPEASIVALSICLGVALLPWLPQLAATLPG